MKQIEITRYLLETEENAIDKLEKQGFKLIRTSTIEDKYLTSKIRELTKDNIQYILKNSVLLRYLNVEGKEFKKITYKYKNVDKDENIISETKININCEDLSEAEELFENLGFELLIIVKYKVKVYEKDGIELAFQNVEGLGSMIEYENEEDFENKNIEEIKKVKQKMEEKIESFGILIEKGNDVKKAKELIEKNIKDKIALNQNKIEINAIFILLNTNKPLKN